MIDEVTLETVITMIHAQAVKKKWKTEGLYCIKRAHEELDELKFAIENNHSDKVIAEEGIDVIYFLFQAILDTAPNIPLSTAFLEKYESNWHNLKKTEDEFGNKVRR